MSMPAIAKPVCPVCGTSCDGPPLHRYTVEQAASHHCPSARDADRHDRLVRCIRRLWNGDRIDIHKCGACTFGFAWPFIGGDAEFYGILHEMAGYPLQRWEFDETIEKVLGPLPPGRVIDIGAGEGAFLGKVPSTWDRWAVETSPHLRGLLTARGIKVVDSAQQALSKGGAFDVATLFQVLEHVSQFREMLGTCRDLLKIGGKLAISVPDGRMIDDLERITGMSDMPPNHINRWTGESLGRALEQQGFVVSERMLEPPSLRNATYYATLKVRAAAQNKPRSLSARSFGIKRRPLRIPVQAGLSGLALLTMAHHLPTLRQGQAMLMISTRS